MIATRNVENQAAAQRPATFRSRVVIFVCGILTFPGASANWTGRAVTWTHLHTPHRAEKVEYYIGPITRPFGQASRARKLLRTLEFYHGWDITLAGHSNGCDVILDALQNPGAGHLSIAHLHLISAACSGDFEANGLNELVPATVKQLTIWRAGQDRALRWANTWTGRMLGYGTLGLTESVNRDCPAEFIVQPRYGHSDWFTDTHLDQTMRRITA